MAAGRNALSPSFFSLTPCPTASLLRPTASPPIPSPKGEGSKMSDKQYSCVDMKVITDAM